MFAELRGAIAQAVLAGTQLDAIERAIINPAPLDDEQKAALWLYAETVADRPARLMPAGSSGSAANRLQVPSGREPRRDRAARSSHRKYSRRQLPAPRADALRVRVLTLGSLAGLMTREAPPLHTRPYEPSSTRQIASAHGDPQQVRPGHRSQLREQPQH